MIQTYVLTAISIKSDYNSEIYSKTFKKLFTLADDINDQNL